MARWQLRSRRLPQSASWQRHRRRRHKARPSPVAGIHAREAPAHVRRRSGAAAWDRRPSVSGGYGRPTTSRPSRSSSSWSLPRSASDQALARQSSREALDTFRQRSQPEVYSRRPSLGSSGSWDGPRRRDPVRETQGCTRGLVRPFGMVTPVLCRPHPAPVWHVGCDVRVVSAQYTCRSPGMPTSSIIMPLIQAIPPGGRKRTGWPPQTRRCAKSWQNWIPGSRPCRRNRASTDYLPPGTTPTIALAADQEEERLGMGVGVHSVPGARRCGRLVCLAPAECWSACARGRRSKWPAFWHVLSAGLVPRWHDVPRRSCTVHSGGEHDACAGARGSDGQRSDQR